MASYASQSRGRVSEEVKGWRLRTAILSLGDRRDEAFGSSRGFSDQNLDNDETFSPNLRTAPSIMSSHKQKVFITPGV